MQLRLLVLALAVIGAAGCSNDESNSPIVPECDPGSPITVSFDDQGTFQTASLALGGLTVSGSGEVQVRRSSGLGVVGGASDEVVDGSEFLRFSIDAGGATGVTYSVTFAGNLDGDALAGESTIEAFDPDGDSLGVVSVDGMGVANLTTAFGDKSIGAFVVRADGDSVRIEQVVYRPCA